MTEDQALRSRRPLTLRFNIPISRTKEFWGALREGRLVTTKCRSCGRVSFPPQSDCPGCMSPEHAWTDLSQEGRVVTFTQVCMPPATFAECDPYIIAICELEGGPKVLAWLEGVGLGDVKPGMRVRLEARPAGGENPYYVFVRA
jgi:hypothetical protein